MLHEQFYNWCNSWLPRKLMTILILFCTCWAIVQDKKNIFGHFSWIPIPLINVGIIMLRFLFFFQKNKKEKNPLITNNWQCWLIYANLFTSCIDPFFVVSFVIPVKLHTFNDWEQLFYNTKLMNLTTSLNYNCKLVHSLTHFWELHYT